MGIRYVVPGPPIAQPRHRVAFGRAYIKKSHPIHGYKDAVAIATRQALQRPYTGPLAIWLVFVLPRPSKTPKKRSRRFWNMGSGKYGRDIDNFVKACMDGMNPDPETKLGGAWADDSQVVWMHAQKLTAALDEEPHTEISIQQLFGNPDELIRYSEEE